MKINLGKRELIHFIGIGGIGMSGLALIMNGLGFRVQGSDISENKNIEKIDDSIVKGLPKINDNSSVQKTKEILTDKEKFREINFSYPQWSPNENDSKILENKPLSSRIKYLDIENSDNKSSFSFKV